MTACNSKVINFLVLAGSNQSPCVGLASRLDKLEGKTIYVNMGEADPVIMPALYNRLNRDYPNVNWKWIGTNEFGPSTPEKEVLENADAVIRGLAW